MKTEGGRRKDEIKVFVEEGAAVRPAVVTDTGVGCIYDLGRLSRGKLLEQVWKDDDEKRENPRTLVGWK